MIKTVMIAARATVWVAGASGAGLARQDQGVVQRGTNPKPGKPTGFMDYTDDACMDQVKGAAPKATCRK